MRIQYIDGTEQLFEWLPDPDSTQTANMVGDLQKSLHEDFILLEMGDKMTIIPKQNIKTIEINAVPPKLPPSAVRGVRSIERSSPHSV